MMKPAHQPHLEIHVVPGDDTPPRIDRVFIDGEEWPVESCAVRMDAGDPIFVTITFIPATMTVREAKPERPVGWEE